MSGRLIGVQILEERTLADEVQLELTWERPAIARGDFSALRDAFIVYGRVEIPMLQERTVRIFASVEAAQAALAGLLKEVQPCRAA